jgi:hypothetical protein
MNEAYIRIHHYCVKPTHGTLTMEASHKWRGLRKLRVTKFLSIPVYDAIYEIQLDSLMR